MITKYRIGNPIDTESVVRELSHITVEGDMTLADARFPDWKWDEESRSLCCRLEKKDKVFGLGETVRGMNKRGWLYISKNSDDPHHEEGKHSLYASQNFVIVFSQRTGTASGIYVDTPGVIDFDIGYTDPDTFTIRLYDNDADIYIVEEATLTDTARAFRELVGRSYIPPKWAFGYGQSRWSYMNEDEVREVVEKHDEAGIPLDMVYLDIDYMDHYKDFTLNSETFPDFPEFVQEMRSKGIHLVPIIDAGVKMEKDYAVYEEGVANGWFCKKEDGENLVAAVWPGKVHFPDFLNEGARRWFGDWYRFLLDQGIDGFWNDMNEPAIFYTEDRLKAVFEALKEYTERDMTDMDLFTFFRFKGLVGSLENNVEDYRTFYHEYKGEKIRHDKVHNIYGYNMTRAAGEAFERNAPDRRILMFSRASYIGMHRYGGVWTGDNKAWWSHILLGMQQMPGLNMCGFLYSGSDTGGFGDDTTEDLLLRWLEFSLFTPLMRNHAAMGTRRQEAYRFGNTQAFRNIISLRYALIPYLYSEFMKSALRSGMYMKPLAFEYPGDERACGVEDQLLVGESIMIAPVYTQNAQGRYVYLPERMKLLRMRSADDFDEEILEKGDHFVPAGLEEVLIFVRPGHVLPLGRAASRVADVSGRDELRYVSFEADPQSYELYEDDGISRV